MQSMANKWVAMQTWCGSRYLHMGKVENYCDAYYNKDKYNIAYSGLHSPLPDLDTLDDIDVLLPPLRRLPRRPRKSRIKKKDKDAPSNARRISTVRCSNCEDLGHNRKGC
ncbi:hypothetical protein Ahy_A07g032331 [Arachis hypogaea]|uniref:CCHC-type domain-containing protein n=1 Tax=Arachis hypogaea TaxID=3818 RepID=A0A445C6S5_ARAHY|nr:hypothetical protein Ahy_A07g032331 [Arachis hypogaea]